MRRAWDAEISHRRWPGVSLWIALGALGAAAAPDSPPPGPIADLTFAERVAAQRVIEQVYREQRAWPAHNPGPKPGRDASMPEAALVAKVEDSLRKSNALDLLWHRPVTTELLQAEMDRMAHSTRAAGTLARIFDGLGRDPHLFAETFARQVLVERLVPDLYAHDVRFHESVREQAQGALAESVRVEDWIVRGGLYREARWRLPESHETLRAWLAARVGSDLPVGKWSALREERECYEVVSITSLGQETIDVATVRWPKKIFAEWWAEHRSGFPAEATPTAGPHRWTEPVGQASCAPNSWNAVASALPPSSGSAVAVWTGSEVLVWGPGATGARYVPATDSWVPMETAEQPTQGQRAVWTGSEMLVWGGLNSAAGGRYNPLTDTWVRMSTTGQPSPRDRFTAVWTGTEMIVWGGAFTIDTGGRYNPTTDTWTATPSGAPTGRYDHSAVWTGSEMIVWGGQSYNTSTFQFTYYNDGKRYVPGGSWQPLPLGNVGVPLARAGHAALWIGDKMIVWAGWGPGIVEATGAVYRTASGWTPVSTVDAPTVVLTNTAVWSGAEMIVWDGMAGGRYDPGRDAWVALPTDGAPSAPADHVAVWTGQEMVVWGGGTDSGGRYDPSADAWTPTFTGYRPEARSGHTAVWTGAEMIVWGGSGTGSPLPHWNSGGRYDPATDLWTPTTMLDAPSPRSEHTAAWTGAEVIVWGGRQDNPGTDVYFDTGARYRPDMDVWLPTGTTGAPSARARHTAVWTGTEMIVWGGSLPMQTNSGGRYDPATNGWSATTLTDAPPPRLDHTAVWTGSEMIVWGDNFSDSSAAGGRYEPTRDAWTSMSPWPLGDRLYHTAVWTGSEMIVWGGSDPPVEVDTGARYAPATDSWTVMQVASAPSPRQDHLAVWNGAEMIVWGGRDGSVLSGTGGRYDPVLDSWDEWGPLAVGGAPTPRYEAPSAWTGAEWFVWGGIVKYQFQEGKSKDGARYCADLAPDSDSDGVSNVSDCQPGQSGVWTLPGPARELTVSDDGQISWIPPLDPGGVDLVYDLLRAAMPDDFGESVCVATAVTATAATDVTPPPAGSAFYYLVRAENTCGSNLGSGSDGVPRAGSECP